MSDRLRQLAENRAGLQQQIDAAGLGDPAKRERDELRAEVEQLRAIAAAATTMVEAQAALGTFKRHIAAVAPEHRLSKGAQLERELKDARLVLFEQLVAGGYINA